MTLTDFGTNHRPASISAISEAEGVAFDVGDNRPISRANGGIFP
jgi:hypothetical protein